MPDIPVQVLKDDWTLALMQKGIIVQLTISRWRASCPVHYDDLGLVFCNDETFNFMKKYVSLGSEKLFPPEVLREVDMLEAKARRNLKNYSFDTIWGNFVPYTAFEEWSKINDMCRDEYLVASKRIAQRYDEIIYTVKENYRQLAKDAWKRIYPNDTKDPSESFVENFTSKIVSRIPPIEQIISSFKYDTTYLSIPLPSFIQEDLRKKALIEGQREIDALKITEERRIISKISLEYQTKKREMIDEFLDNTVQSLRNQVAELFENVLVGLRKNEDADIKKMQADRIKKIIDHIRLLNFQNDKEVEKLISNLDNEISKFKGDRDKSTVLKHLQSIVDLSKKEFVLNDFNPIAELEI